MKAHTQGFKEQIKLIGKEIDSRIIFGETVLGKNDLNAVTPSYQGAILKSVMKQLDIDSNVEIPLGTNLRYEFGLKVNGEYEYINYGDYIVYSIEKQEDINSYKILCYDKLLNSMIPYEKMDITYPINIRSYINAVCNKLGLTFKNRNETFPNYDRVIPSELYLNSEGEDIGYTFRDVFDELAQVTASTICVNENGEVEVRYISETNDFIDEEYLKDVNVNFGQKYGKINSIVLSRSGESDNVYLRDEASVAENGLCELKIIDNQIMNFNDRSDYLIDIFSTLNGLEYYINDFASTGICYLDLCDRYSVQIGDNTYSCVMFNNEVLITQGLEENIYTDMPEETQTDYTKADKTDRKINQTYLIVDKQNQQIEAVVSQTDEQNEKISKVTQTVEELNSKISDIADITISAEDNDAQVEFEKINQSEPVRIVIRPILQNISYLYPRENLFPSDNLFPKTRTIRFTNTKTNEIFDYELPTDLLYYSSEYYDEFILDYDGQSCVVNKKVGYNPDGTTYVLEKETTLEFEYPRILLTDGDYNINILGYDTAYLFARLMAQNIYTTQFATKAEVTSEINQTANSINLKVEEKLDEEYFTGANIMLEINKDTSFATINADKISLEGKEINLTSDDININSNNFKVDKNGNINLTSGRQRASFTIDGLGYTGTNNTLKLMSDGLNIYDSNGNELLVTRNSRRYINGQYYNSFYLEVMSTNGASSSLFGGDITVQNSSGLTKAGMYGESGIVECVNLYQTSKVEEKKNFEKFDNALDIINKVDIYKYHFKDQKDNDKKHIGFVIGDNYKYSKEITSINNNGVDIYSMASVCFKAIQEQQKQIEELKKELNILKEMIN